MEAKPLFNALAALLPRPGTSFLRPPVPAVGVEVGSRGVTVVRLRKDRRGLRCAGHGWGTLSEGAVQTALLKCVVTEQQEFLAAMKEAMTEAGVRGGRAALALPDIAGRVTLLSVPGLPRSRSQAEELIRFRLKRTLPFRPEDVAISFSRMSPTPEGDQVLAVLAMRSVIEQLERLLAEAGLRVGLVSLTTLELANLFRGRLAALGEASSEGGRSGHAALLNCEPEYSTLALFRGGEMIFFRCKIHMEEEETDPASRLRSLRRELTTSLSYYSEKLGGRLPIPALVRNLDPLTDGLSEILQDIGLSPAAGIDLTERVGLPDEGALLGVRLAPAVGITGGRKR